MKTILILILSIYCVHSTEMRFGSYENSMPSYIYSINLAAGDNVLGHLSWNTSADLDIFMYENGQNVMNDSGYVVRAYNEWQPQSLSFTANSPGLYYFRISLFSSQTPTAYKFDITVNGVLQRSYYDTVLSKSSGRSVQQIRVQNACRLKIVYSGSIYPLYLYKPGENVVSGTPFQSDISNTPQKIIDTVLDVAGNWNLVIDHDIISTTNPYAANYTIDAFTFSDNECITFCSGKANSLGLASGTTNICLCVQSFKWDSNSSSCLIDCPSIAKTIILVGSTDSCQCQAGFAWSVSNKVCEIECSNISKATGIVSGRIDECECQAGYAWSASNTVCQRNCSDILFATSIRNGSIDECQCQADFVWNVSSYVCERKCQDILYATSIKNGNVDECQCETGFVWNVQNQVCEFNCSAVANSTGLLVANTVDECSCEEVFQWDKESKSCYVSKRQIVILATTGSVAIVVANLGILIYSIIQKKIAIQSISNIVPEPSSLEIA